MTVPGVERLAAVVVLVLGTLLLLAATVGAVREPAEITVWDVLVALLVVMGTWRAGGHLRRPSPAR